MNRTDTVPDVVPTVPVVRVTSSSLVPAIAPAIVMSPPLVFAGLPMFVWIVRFAPLASNTSPPTNSTSSWEV